MAPHKQPNPPFPSANFEMENHAAEIKLAERRNEQRLDAPELRQYRAVYWTRLALRVLSLITCGLVLFGLLDATRTYERTKHLKNRFRESTGSFPVWPEVLKLYPSYVLVGAAVTAGLTNLVLVLACFVKSVRRMTKVGNIATVAVSVICLILWISVISYYKSWDNKKTNWDLMSWSCTHSDPKYDYREIDFSNICTEMRFAYWAGLGLAALEVVNLSIFVVWWLVTRRSRGYSKV